VFTSAYWKCGCWFLREFENGAPTSADPVEIRFGASRDGITWQRSGRRASLPLGMKERFDAKALHMAWGIVLGPEGEMYMHNYGCDGVHGWNRNQENKDLIHRAGLGARGKNSAAAISGPVLRTDGFLSDRADCGGGLLTTPLMRFAGDQLELNVDTSALGDLRVKTQDQTGRFLDSHGLDGCVACIPPTKRPAA
jgi:hypothetical protein